MKKILRYGLISLAVLLLLSVFGGYLYFKDRFFSTTPSRLALSTTEGSIPFIWTALEHEGWTEPHDAMLIPVRLKGLVHTFYMQFDLGSQHSLLYWKPISSLREKGLDLDLIQNDEGNFLSQFNFEAGDISVDATKIKVRNYGTEIDWTNPRPQIIIGTLGADLIDKAFVGIDFKNQIFNFYPSEPIELMNGNEMSTFDMEGRRFLFPAEIKGESYTLMYDSGSSPFGLVTNKANFENLSLASEIDRPYHVNSWGDPIPVHNKSSSNIISIGGAELPLNRVSYFEYNETLSTVAMRLSPINGLLGNKVFLNSVLLLNTHEGEFMVLEAL